LRWGRLDDGVMQFTGPAKAARAERGVARTEAD